MLQGAPWTRQRMDAACGVAAAFLTVPAIQSQVSTEEEFESAIHSHERKS